MYENAFNSIERELRNEDGIANELDYVEQISWVQFLKYLHDLETERRDRAELDGETYTPIIDGPFRWDRWAAPKVNGAFDHNAAMVGEDLITFVDQKLFPYLATFRQSATSAKTIHYKIGEIFTELRNKFRSGYSLALSASDHRRHAGTGCRDGGDSGKHPGDDVKAGWKVRKLGEMIDLISGQHIDSKDYNTAGKGVGYLTGPSDFGPLFPIVTKWTEAPKRFAESGDVLLTVKGSGVGKINVLDIERVAISRQIMAVRAVGIVPQFLYLLLHSLQDHFHGLANGAAIPGISRPDVTGYEFPLPPLEEQHQIVAVLDEAFEGLARARAHAEANLRDARELFENLLDAVFVNCPDHWTRSDLGSTCQFVGGSQPPKSDFVYSPGDGLVRLVQIRDYKSDRNVVYLPEKLARRFCKKDDIMIGRYGPPLFQILRGIKGAYNVALMKAVPNPNLISKDFLYYFLRNGSILRYINEASSRAAGQIGLNKATLEPYPIAFPPLEEQAEVVQRLDAASAECDDLIERYAAKVQQVDALRQSLLQKAFAGELT